MTDKNLYANDLIHRFASHTFTETTVQSETKVEFKNSSSAVIRKSQKLLAIDAYRAIRNDLLGAEVPLFLSTTIERDALTSVDKGTTIYNITTNEDETYNGTSWVAAGGETGGEIHLPITGVITQNNTQTVAKSITLLPNKSYLFTVKILGEVSDHSIVAGFIIECTAKRQPGGSAVIVGNPTTIHNGKDSTASSWNATCTVSGNDFGVSVTGGNNITVNWDVDLSYLVF